MPLPELPLPGVLGGLEAPALHPQTLLGTEFWKTRCVFEYPAIDEAKRTAIKEALEWYEYYEMLQAKPKEDDSKKKKKKAAKPSKKKKVEEEVVVKVPTGKNWSPFDLEVATMKLRSATASRVDPSVESLVAQALGASPGTETRQEEYMEEPLSEFDAPPEAEEESFAPQSTLTDELPPARRADFPIPKAQIPTFQYFWSEEGLGWLMDSGEIDRKQFEHPKDVAPPLPAPTFPSAWDPMTVDELAAAEEQQRAAEDLRAREEAEATARTAEEIPISNEERRTMEIVPDYPPEHGLGYLGNVVRTENVENQRPSSPPGPHPDKKSAKYDVYGEHRAVPPEAEKAFLGPNVAFLEVEAETDRRVRPASVVLKKNARLAPSVQAVRRAGSHVLRGLSEDRGVGAVQDADVQARDPQMTSTMQGLGDPSTLVEVQPGRLGFGMLRVGGIYRLAVYVKNLDVDVTRYIVKPLEEPYMKLWYAHTPLAPGMSVKIVVEIVASRAMKIDTFLDVRVKAHCIKVPIAARVLDPDEYDALETESMRLHGRKLVKRGVELVTDEKYCKKTLGFAYSPPLENIDGSSLDF
jgi:hypothetical protein